MIPRVLLLLLLLATGTSQAASLRCGSALVSTGSTTHEVRGKCGAPLSVTPLGERQVTDGYGYRQVEFVEEWAYGPWNGMLYFLTFRGGRLDQVDSKRAN
ncbi:DUF2845 domain-containing protein [Pseudomonas oryzihabitans]|uniref:DUF2845 domain-containing protein n=1 Tax=Pseudomonas oryzihabitans TaxID=47885 RepID=UPI00135F051F|nr:DUF2845 domain-containing protein [Pseudomonas oryzihabitans]MXS17436.1 DUF2845 domain-containing protein [Pseudomonas oryzihabitans]